MKKLLTILAAALLVLGTVDLSKATDLPQKICGKRLVSEKILNKKDKPFYEIRYDTDCDGQPDTIFVYPLHKLSESEVFIVNSPYELLHAYDSNKNRKCESNEILVDSFLDGKNGNEEFFFSTSKDKYTWLKNYFSHCNKSLIKSPEKIN